jgi:hypothetical protein
MHTKYLELEILLCWGCIVNLEKSIILGVINNIEIMDITDY